MININLPFQKEEIAIKEYYIYAHISKETGEVLYIGKGSVYKNCKGDRAYDFRKRKYTIEEVNIIKLPMRYTEEELAYQIEKMITQHYKDLGQCKYNTYIGHEPSQDFKEKYLLGENNPMYGKRHTQQAKDQISQKRKESGVVAGENNPMYGKHHTEETREKMRQNRKTHIVYCYETDKYYKGTGHAGEELGMNRGMVANCCVRGTMGFSKTLNKRVKLEYRDEE